jgi:hypothetical protein
MITIGRYRFDGPVYNKASLRDAPGVYAVLDDRGCQRFIVLDVGESEQIRTRIENHDREDCWRQSMCGKRCYAALYMPGSSKEQRQAVEGDLRRQYSPTCGVR